MGMFDAIYILLAVGFFCCRRACSSGLASGCEGGRMAIELILGGAVARRCSSISSSR